MTVRKLTESQENFLINVIRTGEAIPLDFKHLLFPPERQECELVFNAKEREEDILAETMSVPLQPIRSFGSSESSWNNMLIFGDNLQTMKTLLKLKEKGQLINSDGTRGVKLVYIDPPFGTGDTYGPSNGEMSYSAKAKGVEFISFLRKRLVFLREILASNGSVMVRLDYHFGHYIKVIMDEVFGQQNFRNEIVINRIKRSLRNLTRFNVSTESIYYYSKSSDYNFINPEAPRRCGYCKQEKDPVWDDLTSPGLRNPRERVIFGKVYLPRRGRHFTYTQKKIDLLEKEGRLRLNPDIAYYDLEDNKIEARPEYLQTDDVPIDNNWTDIKGYAFANDYPTENHEELLERVIRSASSEGDIVLDAFAGSGTTLAVSEKLGRKWIGIDCSKLSIYTIQKRMVNLRHKIGNQGKSLSPKPFTLYNAGLYDFSQLKKLSWDDWRFFALHLFQCQDEPHEVGGIALDGHRNGDDVLVFNHTFGGGVVLDYGFIDDLHAQIGSRIGAYFFIIAPAASVAFLEDYVDKGATRYYVMRIPYSIINELHSRNFTSIIQPIDEDHVNDTVDAVGFDFIRQPKVNCDYYYRYDDKKIKQAITKITMFKSLSMAKGASLKSNLETLSMVLVDYDYPFDLERKGTEAIPPFEVNKVFYAKEISEADWEVRLPFASLGKYIMIIYIDIYGNEHTEIKTPKDFEQNASSTS